MVKCDYGVNTLKAIVPRKPRLAQRAFSLIEAVIAIGIVSFAMLGILGLIPVGLGNFQSAMQLTIEATIVQGISSDLQNTASTNLDATNYYFDEQGTKVSKSEAIFTANISKPQDLAASDLVSKSAAQVMQIEVNARFRPDVTNRYSVIIPRGQK